MSSSATPYPVLLTAFEIRYPSTPRIRAALPSLAEALSSRFSHSSIGKDSELERTSLGFGAHRGLLEPALLTMSNSSRTEACTVRQNAATLEVTRYDDYLTFRAVLREFVVALYRTHAIISIERVGLRYLDELHTSSAHHSVDWAEWVSPLLLGPLQLVGAETPTDYTGALRLQPGPDLFLSMRWGALRRPALRQSMGTGLRITRPPGTAPVFMLDLDGSWRPRQREFNSVDDVMAAVDRLHDLTKNLFTATVTEELRAQIAMTPPANHEREELVHE
ncbi:TIGR04255 family protein [Actinoplanes subtropicus]|uniref:TIGR04255 family protein n=1 Tax=Actinoplanes subtropicus TaxID=543632 RepID=UPI000A0256CC